MKKKLLALIVAVVATMSIGMTAFAAEEPTYYEANFGDYVVLPSANDITAENFNIRFGSVNYDACITNIAVNYPEESNKWETVRKYTTDEWVGAWTALNVGMPNNYSIIQFKVTVDDPYMGKPYNNIYTINFADRSVVYNWWDGEVHAYNISQVTDYWPDDNNHFIYCGELYPEEWNPLAMK